jgi:hypothetical protein
MNKKSKILIVLLITIPVVIVIGLYSYVYIGLLYFGPSKTDLDNNRRKIIYEIDHNKLIEACRKLMSEAMEGKWDAGEYYLRDIEDRSVVYKNKVEKMPQEIIELEPAYILITEDKVRIEMHGGIVHFGITVSYSNNLEPKGYEKYFGNKQLIEGLWYYDDGFQKDPNFAEYLESLRPKSKSTESPPK